MHLLASTIPWVKTLVLPKKQKNKINKQKPHDTKGDYIKQDTNKLKKW